MHFLDVIVQVSRRDTSCSRPLDTLPLFGATGSPPGSTGPHERHCTHSMSYAAKADELTDMRDQAAARRATASDDVMSCWEPASGRRGPQMDQSCSSASEGRIFAEHAN